MPKKFDFSVVYVTSEDSKFRSTEFNTHGPCVKGWQSAKNCEYPQEIIIKLHKRCILDCVQILAHQHLIPTQVDLYYSNDDTNTVEDVANINWEYVGYILLSDNVTANFNSRELKSANVPAHRASFIKLVLYENHKNEFNVNNQVSLIAINILGMDVETRRLSNAEGTTEDKLQAILNNPEYTSPYDDLYFIMYVDTDVAKIIREMEIKKHLAVISERFEYARKLKHAMLSLKTAGEKLGKYELEKRHAIEKEDYERARQKKMQMDEFRNKVYQAVGVDQLLEINGICHKNDECADEADSRNLLSPTLMRSDKRASSPNQNHGSPLLPRHQSPKRNSPNMGSPTNMQNRGSFRRRNKSAGSITKSTYEMYEEKPLPALRHSHTNEFLRECQMDADVKVQSKLTEREKKQAALPILVFGNDLVEKFYSKNYCDKEDGLNKLKDDLLSYDKNRMHTANKTGRAAIFLLHRALRDKVFSVYNLANEVIRLYFTQFVPGRVTPTEVARSVDKLLPELLTKSGDTSARIHHMAVHTILTMADCKNVSGLTCRTLSEFGSSGLHHPAEAVRKVSERILVLVYKVNPRLVRKQLPPDDDITRRNLLYRQLFHEFDKIDLQRKKEMLERNRLIQQCSMTTNPDCFSPEPISNEKTELTKCPSTTNIASYDVNPTNKISKSLSGGHLINNGIKNEHERQSSSSASGISTPSNNSQKEEDDKQCIFCNQLEATILAVSNSMNSHYWRTCPMLVRCKECSQVVEVATLTEHLLVECEKHQDYTQCSQCSEAIRIDEIQNHSTECTELTEGCNRCPLCHENLEDEEFCWRKHFMGNKPCTRHTRVKTTVHKQVVIQG
ncbi:centrosomal protein of 104 kDa isoform X2 [Aethina tumida]|uniref:centrosomal protein of 104 kDa isoform X2 n=1 Tax=Aethina tumida TaxID=116153 RepID=UPI0021472C1A|nr:centrosomal protein of 104 kDa isoform X2 [Aethina tumida]